MKMNQKYIIIYFLAGLIIIQCEPKTGWDCTYRELQGYITFNKIDTAMSKNYPENYYVCWSRFISSDYSDTIDYCYHDINVGCINDGIIAFDSTYPCIWKRKISGGCAPGPIKINSIPDTCYNGDLFKCYE